MKNNRIQGICTKPKTGKSFFDLLFTFLKFDVGRTTVVGTEVSENPKKKTEFLCLFCRGERKMGELHDSREKKRKSLEGREYIVVLPVSRNICTL